MISKLYLQRLVPCSLHFVGSEQCELHVACLLIAGQVASGLPGLMEGFWVLHPAVCFRTGRSNCQKKKKKEWKRNKMPDRRTSYLENVKKNIYIYADWVYFFFIIFFFFDVLGSSRILRVQVLSVRWCFKVTAVMMGSDGNVTASSQLWCDSAQCKLSVLL